MLARLDGALCDADRGAVLHHRLAGPDRPQGELVAARHVVLQDGQAGSRAVAGGQRRHGDGNRVVGMHGHGGRQGRFFG